MYVDSFTYSGNLSRIGCEQLEFGSIMLDSKTVITFLFHTLRGL